MSDERGLTEFEVRVMRHAQHNKRLPLGDKRVAWAGAARRLQKRGLLMQFGNGGGWAVTAAGAQALARHEKAEIAQEWHDAPAIIWEPEVQP